MAGLLLGILLARTVASLVAAAWAGVPFTWLGGPDGHASVMLARMLPRRVPELGGFLPRLMLSTVRLVREEPALRRRAACHGAAIRRVQLLWYLESVPS